MWAWTHKIFSSNGMSHLDVRSLNKIIAACNDTSLWKDVLEIYYDARLNLLKGAWEMKIRKIAKMSIFREKRA